MAAAAAVVGAAGVSVAVVGAEYTAYAAAALGLTFLACAPDGSLGLTAVAPARVVTAIHGKWSTTGLIALGLEIRARNKARMAAFARGLLGGASPLRGGGRRTVMITGASRGLGAGVAAHAAAGGARLVLPLRDRGEEAAVRARVEEAAAALGGGADLSDAVFPQLDLASLASVDACAGELQEKGVVLDALINNAGMMPIRPGLTKEGFEPAFGVNYLGPVRLTDQLAERGVLPIGRGGAPPVRVVNVSSEEHRHGVIGTAALPFGAVGKPSLVNAMKRYASSKLALATWSHELRREWDGKAEVFDICPGPVASEIARNAPWPINHVTKLWMGLIFPTTLDAALPVLWLACDPGASGGAVHWHMSEAREAGAGAADPTQGVWVWQHTQRLLSSRAPPPADEAEEWSFDAPWIK